MVLTVNFAYICFGLLLFFISIINVFIFQNRTKRSYFQQSFLINKTSSNPLFFSYSLNYPNDISQPGIFVKDNKAVFIGIFAEFLPKFLGSSFVFTPKFEFPALKFNKYGQNTKELKSNTSKEYFKLVNRSIYVQRHIENTYYLSKRVIIKNNTLYSIDSYPNTSIIPYMKYQYNYKEIDSLIVIDPNFISIKSFLLNQVAQLFSFSDEIINKSYIYSNLDYFSEAFYKTFQIPLDKIIGYNDSTIYFCKDLYFYTYNTNFTNAYNFFQAVIPFLIQKLGLNKQKPTKIRYIASANELHQALYKSVEIMKSFHKDNYFDSKFEPINSYQHIVDWIKTFNEYKYIVFICSYYSILTSYIIKEYSCYYDVRKQI